MEFLVTKIFNCKSIRNFLLIKKSSIGNLITLILLSTAITIFYWNFDFFAGQQFFSQLKTLYRTRYLPRDFNGTCGEEAWKRGFHQKVVSFCFYDLLDRSDHPYWREFNTTLNSVATLYPGWQARVYATKKDISVLKSHITMRDFLSFCDVNHLPPPLNKLESGVMTWRFTPMGDPQVDVMIVRDIESVIGEREVAAVNEWLASNKTLHAMRDHPGHKHAIMGGMWGIKMNDTNREKLRALRDEMFRLGKGNWAYNKDQGVLKTVLWPAFEDDNMGHDSFNGHLFKGSKPFPTARNGLYVARRYRYSEPSNETIVKKNKKKLKNISSSKIPVK